ncbi:MAG: hypothetical protein ACRDTG_28640 [Pseudonocardiaceae bacterium]
MFADVLDSPDGVRSQLLVIARYLKRVEYGEFSDLADLFHNHAHHLIATFDLLSRRYQGTRDLCGAWPGNCGLAPPVLLGCRGGSEVPGA